MQLTIEIPDAIAEELGNVITQRGFAWIKHYTPDGFGSYSEMLQSYPKREYVDGKAWDASQAEKETAKAEYGE